MKKVLFTVFFLTAFALSAQQDEALYNLSRQVIYGESPISVATTLSDTALDGLQDYAMKMTDPKTIKQLNGDDAWLLSMLIFIEINRRDAANTTEFLVYLQGRKEWLATQPINGRTGRAEGWLDVYEAQIRFGQLKVGK